MLLPLLHGERGEEGRKGSGSRREETKRHKKEERADEILTRNVFRGRGRRIKKFVESIFKYSQATTVMGRGGVNFPHASQKKAQPLRKYELHTINRWEGNWELAGIETLLMGSCMKRRPFLTELLKSCKRLSASWVSSVDKFRE